MNAEQANKIAHEAQMEKVYRRLKEEIEKAVVDGDFRIYTYQILVPELIEKLSAEGYTVSERKAGTTFISW